MNDIPSDIALHPQQPLQTDIVMADGIFVKQIVVPAADTWIPQHSHAYDHATFIATGAVGVWEDGVYRGEAVAPRGIAIAANVKHTFCTRAPGTTIYCIHRIDRTGEVEVSDEHEIVGGRKCQ